MIGIIFIAFVPWFYLLSPDEMGITCGIACGLFGIAVTIISLL